MRALGGTASTANGGKGRIAIYSLNTPTIGSSDPSPSLYALFGTPTPTPSPSATPTPSPTVPAGWQGAQYTYGGAQPHAVTSVQRPGATDTFEYDANGNMIERSEGGVTWTQTFNSENRLASVSDGTETWTFVYDGDSNRVKQINLRWLRYSLSGRRLI